MDKLSPFPPGPMRAAMLASLPEHDQSSPVSRGPAFTYVPPSHAKALHPDNPVVQGMRGAGKSHWWAALHDRAHRSYLAEEFPEAKISLDYEVSQGFGLRLDPALAPTKDILADLTERHPPRSIWRAVVGVHAKFEDPFPRGSWDQRVSWVSSHAEQYDSLLYAAGSRRQLILFDALDRLADEWPRIRPLARELLRLALDLMALPALRLKVFVRPDMLQDAEILKFPDSSKLSAKTADLHWRRTDLYALLFQCIANDPGSGGDFRARCAELVEQPWMQRAGAAWTPPRELRTREESQKIIFHGLTGPHMANGPNAHKRGFPYSWLPNHLIDGRDQVSPRSFFAAVRSAAEQSEGDKYALDYRAIQRGVQAASEIRVKEITQEDYPWVRALMSPMRGRINVPCSKPDILQIWEDKHILAAVRDELSREDVKLLPPRFEQGYEGLLEDLRDLGVISYLVDERIQIPDVYRIAFGLGRRGGVKPLQ